MYKLGDTVRIKPGPFANFVGVVERVDEIKSALIVRVEIFGRSTPVEAAFSEVEKLSTTHPPISPPTSLN